VNSIAVVDTDAGGDADVDVDAGGDADAEQSRAEQSRVEWMVPWLDMMNKTS